MHSSDPDAAPGVSAGEEEILIAAFLRGERSASEQVDSWIDVVLRAQVAALRDELDDLKQEVRARVFRNLSRSDFEARSSLRTYVHQIAKNVCIDLLRSTRRREAWARSVHGSDPGAGSGDASRALAAKDLVRKIFDELSESEQELFVLAFVEHRSYTEIAEKLSIPEGTVKSRMSRCKDRILERRRKLLRWESKEP